MRSLLMVKRISMLIIMESPEEDSKVKRAKRCRVEENMTWAECVL